VEMMNTPAHCGASCQKTNGIICSMETTPDKIKIPRDCRTMVLKEMKHYPQMVGVMREAIRKRWNSLESVSSSTFVQCDCGRFDTSPVGRKARGKKETRRFKCYGPKLTMSHRCLGCKFCVLKICASFGVSNPKKLPNGWNVAVSCHCSDCAVEKACGTHFTRKMTPQ